MPQRFGTAIMHCSRNKFAPARSPGVTAMPALLSRFSQSVGGYPDKPEVLLRLSEDRIP
jgi:hypothetical protein